MRMRGDYEEHTGMSPTMVAAIAAAVFFVAAILVIVLLTNQDGSRNKDHKASASREPSLVIVEPDPETAAREEILSPRDLDFWDRYPPQETQKPAQTESPKEQTQENNPASDGRHTRIENPNGTEDWVLISPYLPKHEYDFTRLVCQSDRMKYFENGTQVSYEGVDLSEVQDYVDFVEVKKSGIDFVMLRAGARGYGTGQLLADEYIGDNLKRASDAGLEIGVYFFSQAVSREEAEEEAGFVIGLLNGYSISYPIAYEMERIPNDTSRIDTLSKSEKTEIAKAFLDAVEAAGYKTLLYGSKEWLIRQVDLSKLTAYDVWLSQEADVPDYPYRFSMWQYSRSGKVEGVSGYVNLNISFVDYSEK